LLIIVLKSARDLARPKIRSNGNNGSVDATRFRYNGENNDGLEAKIEPRQPDVDTAPSGNQQRDDSAKPNAAELNAA
jgi:hypothetical protein